MALDIPEIKEQRAILSASGKKVRIEGEIDQNSPDRFLAPFFNQINQQMEDEIILDISDLQYINSAAIGCIIEFLMHRITNSLVTIRVDRSKVWQRYSIDVLKSLDDEHIILEEENPVSE